MDISKIDKNLKVESTLDLEGLTWYDAGQAPVRIHGADSVNPYRRMPEDVAKAVSPGVASLAKNTAGIRARFRTDSPYIAIHVTWEGICMMHHMPVLGMSGFDLYRVNGGEQFYCGSYMPPHGHEKGFDSVIHTEGQMQEYVINFPLYNPVTSLHIGIKEGSVIEPGSDYSNEKPVVFYGSSITQGGCAARPGVCYQNFLSRALDMDYINLGFSGCAKGEDAMIEYLAGLDMSVFVCDYDHNAPNAEHLKATHYPLYKAVREKHPDIPYIIVTKPDFWPGDELRRAACFATYARALEEGDQNVYFVDGAAFFAGDEADACTVDGCHPNALGFYRMAQGMLPTLRKVLK